MSPRKERSLTRRFREYFGPFCFFHLGSDATIQIQETSEGISVLLGHHRIETFRFSLSQERLQALLEAPDELESYLLGEMTAHRR